MAVNKKIARSIGAGIAASRGPVKPAGRGAAFAAAQLAAKKKKVGGGAAGGGGGGGGG